MRLVRFRATNGVFVLVLLSFSVFAYFVAPFSPGDKTILTVKGNDVDAMQQCLLIGSGIDKLLTDPQSYYDTAVLYPDKTQLRTTEPFLGYAILGLPLRTILNLSDKSVFEVLRWLVVFLSLLYSYLLFRAMDMDVSLSVAGAVLCASQADVLRRVESLQILSILLVAPIFYHFIMAWRSGRLGHSAGVFVFVALYPLCGMINGVIAAMALLFMLPLLLRTLAAQQRQKRLTACVLPILLAVVVDVLAITPWLLDRADLKAYSTSEFLKVKHWNPMQVPAPLRDIPEFVAERLGLGFAAALALLCLFIARRYLRRTAHDQLRQAGTPLPSQSYLLVPLVCAEAVLVSSSRDSGSVVAAVILLLFHVSSYLTLFMFWRSQTRLCVSGGENGIAQYGLLLGGGMGVLLCLMSFGPVHVSNSSLLANHLLSSLLYVLPPLSSIREIGRVWVFGVLFLSIYLTVRLGMALRSSALVTRATTAVVIVGAALCSVHERQIVASPSLEAPRNIVELATKSRGKGGIYVHPYMKWNTPSSVLMISAAKELGRPIVNGCLGIIPPWFIYASNVLHRFPDPEAVWLLQQWNVDTVVSLVGDVQVGESVSVRKVFESASGVAYDIATPPGNIPHPSRTLCSASDDTRRLDAAFSRVEPVADGAALTVSVPRGFLASGMEISFRLSVVERVPVSIDVFAFEGGRRLRVNHEQSGEWIESLAADALLRRESPVATINVNPRDTTRFEVEFRRSERPPVERIVLCGQWTN